MTHTTFTTGADDRRAAMCFGKQAFDRDRATANRVVREHNASRRGNGNDRRKTKKEPVEAISCRFCGGWHVGKDRRI